ncbi:MAG: phosphoribosylaminoimidazolesuccinocarboxamide synthase [Planctomycetota bacterium]
MNHAPSEPILSTDLPFAQKIASGKVRDVYLLGDDLLLVATDRISAFDVIMAEGIPDKGRILTAVSAFWFQHLEGVIPHHLLSTDVDAWSDIPPAYRDLLRGRTMRCLRAEPMPVEWVVRGYLTGSGWKDYQATGVVSGVQLPAGMQHASKIEPAILTPSTKAEAGHDEPISFERAVELVGAEAAHAARDAALALYEAGRVHAASRGIVIADTKFEFGMRDGQVLLIDECLTPDSSRFWPVDEVVPGGKPTSYDKQVLRDWLSEQNWNYSPPPPAHPEDVVARTAATYREIRDRLTRGPGGPSAEAT